MRGKLDNSPTFGTALRQLRKERGLSLQVVVAQAGISYATLSYWETGKTRPRLPELDCVLQTLGISAAERRTLLGLLSDLDASRVLHRLEAAGVSAISGDLLWSMRLRKGWTQADTARAVGVHQAQIARWERGEAWPDAQKLHALCWHLKAHPEEVANLTMGIPPVAGGSTLSATSAAIASVNKRIGGTASYHDPQWWSEYLIELHNGTPPVDSLMDLTMLTVENQLRSSRSSRVTALLPAAYAIHARYHLSAGRLRPAALLAERGLALLNHPQSRLPLHFAVTHHVQPNSVFWFGNVIVVAEIANASPAPSRQRYAVDVLRRWLPALPQKVEGRAIKDGHRGWGLSTLALALGKSGDHEEALAVSEQACAPILSHNQEDHLYRQVDHAQLLIDVGRYRQALDALGQCRTPSFYVPTSHYVKVQRLQEECLRGLGSREGDER